MEEARKKLGRVRVLIVWIEIGILFLIGVFGLITTMEAVEFDSSFRPYYLVGLIGIAFVLLLYLLAQNGFRLVWLIGLSLIAVFAVVTWKAYVPANDRSRALEQYLDLIGYELRVDVDGVSYDWTGYKTVKDTDISSHTTRKQAQAVIVYIEDEKEQEKQQSWTLYYDPSEDTWYSSADKDPGKYFMVLQKKETE